jgi:ATP-dependent Lon protease
MATTLIEKQKPTIKNELPIVPLRDTVVFPSSMVPITVGRNKVKLGLDKAWASDRLAIFVAQKNPRVENPAPNDIYQVGTVGLIRRLWKVDNEYNLAVEGLSRLTPTQQLKSKKFQNFLKRQMKLKLYLEVLSLKLKSMEN